MNLAEVKKKLPAIYRDTINQYEKSLVASPPPTDQDRGAWGTNICTWLYPPITMIAPCINSIFIVTVNGVKFSLIPYTIEWWQSGEHGVVVPDRVSDETYYSGVEQLMSGSKAK